MTEPIYRDAVGRSYTVRDGVSVWLSSQPDALVTSMEYVGFGRRLAARLLDFVLTSLTAAVVGAVLALGILVVGGILGRSYFSFLDSRQQSSAISYGFSFLAAVLFEVAAEGLHGSTPGKMMLGITVRSADGGYCSTMQALKRSLGLLLDGLFFGIVGYASIRESRCRQRYGDRWAGTVVVRSGSLDASQRRSGLRFAGATAAAIAAYSAFAALSSLT